MSLVIPCSSQLVFAQSSSSPRFRSFRALASRKLLFNCRLSSTVTCAMKSYKLSDLTPTEVDNLKARPRIDFSSIFSTVQPIVDDVRTRGDAAVKESVLIFSSVCTFIVVNNGSPFIIYLYINDVHSSCLSLAMAAVPASILTLGALFLLETPNSLIQHNQDPDKAKKMLQKVRGTDDIQPEFNDLVSANEISKTIKHPFKNILRQKYRPQLVMAILIPFFQQVTGINVISFYAPILFRTIGFGESASLMSAVVTGSVGLSMTFLSLLIVDKVGRRTVFTIGGVQMFVSQILVGSIMAAKLGDHSGLSKGYGFLVLILICSYVAGFGLSWGPLGWLIPSEIFPLEIRSAGQSITVAVGFLFTFIVAQTFLAMLCHMKSGTFFFFGGWVAVMTVFVYFFLPETKNVPIETMDRIWKQHWFWKRYVGEDDDKDTNNNPIITECV